MNPWIATSDRLPRAGEAVLFVVEQRCIVLRGVYADCVFKSRWSRYSPGDISEWCRVGIDAAAHVCNDPDQPPRTKGLATARAA